MAPCTLSCSIAAVFLLGMIYMHYACANSQIILNYYAQLPPPLRAVYKQITHERTTIYYQGYVLGLLLSLGLVLANQYSQHKLLTNTALVCLVLATSFLTNYFYYMLAPKTDWMLKHTTTPQQTRAWLHMYRGMQVYYHTGLVLGLLAVACFAYAFRFRK